MNNNASRVLIIDDLSVNRMILSSLLASRGVVSEQADSGFKCLEMVKAKDYDLILLDHRMPDMDGVDTLVQLKGIYSGKRDAAFLSSAIPQKKDAKTSISIKPQVFQTFS